MSFPNPPVPGQVYDHPNGLEYVYSADTKTWDLVYATGTNTGSLPLINPSSLTLPTSLPEVPPGTVVQADYNAWLFDALQHVNKEANIEVEAAPGPTNPDEGRLWYNSDSGKLYLYFNDGDSNQWVEISGGDGSSNGGKESTPFVDWHQFKVIERSSRFDYDPLFDTNPIATTEWQYQIDLTGAGGFANVEDIPEGILTSIGWYGSMSVSHLRLNKTDDQMGTYPDAMVRFRVFTSLNGVDNEEFSCSLPAWVDGECDYESSVSSLAARVEEGEDKQDEVVAAIQQIQVQGLSLIHI